jgi:glycosyltransferase involved in cell wall biosynthesis
MTAAVFAIPGDINLPTGGYTYDRRVMALLPEQGVEVQHMTLPGGYPAPTPDDLATTAQAFAQAERDAVLLVDGLAYGAMPADVIAAARGPIVALVHHPLCLETGVSAERQAVLKASETAALALARHVVVTSATTAGTLMAQFGVPAEKITVAEPGTDPARRAKASRTVRGRTSDRLELLAVGSIVPRKGYDVLVAALARLADLDWRLVIAGDGERSPDTTAALRAQIRRSRVGGRITLTGPLDEDALAALYTRTDLFVMSSRYEGYGMVLGEALVRGLPIVATTGGAAAATAPDRAALKVPPGNVDALSRAVRRAMTDAALRRKLAGAAWAAGQRLPRWRDTARIVAGAIAGAAPGGRTGDPPGNQP